jgi:hypothetical protein
MPVMDVKLSGGGKYLYAATFGRKRVAAGLVHRRHGGRRERHRAGDAGADARRVRELRRVRAGRGLRLHCDHHRERDLLGGAPVPLGGTPATLLTYAGPVSNDPVAVTFAQHIAAGDPLGTGGYAKTLTFTSTTTSP